MVLFIHIITAVASIGYTAYALFSPSKPKLNASYALIALTLATGTLLVVTTSVHMLQVCTEGLVYVGLMLGATVVIRHRIIKQSNAQHSLV